MPDDYTPREQLLRAVIAVTLTGIGLATGATIPTLAMLAGVAAGIGGNWLSNLTEDLYRNACDRTFRSDDELNHDLAWALATVLPAAINSVRRQWRQSEDYQRLRRSDNPDDRDMAKRTLLSLHWLSRDAPRVLTEEALCAAMPDAHRQLHTLAHTTPVAEAQKQAQTLLADRLQPYFVGRPPAFTAFVAERLLASWLLRLREILKDPGERSTRAYRAYTLLWNESISAGLERLTTMTDRTAQEVQHILTEVRRLAAQVAQVANTSPAPPPLLAPSDLERLLCDQVLPRLEAIQRSLEAIQADTSAIRAWLEQHGPLHRSADPVLLAQAHTLFAQLPTADLPAPSVLPPGSRMPFARTPTFVGRVPDLQAIAVVLKDGQAAAVHGLGGVGKTTVAGEFVHRYGPYFAGGVFWLSFANPANIPTEIAQCGGEGHLQLRPDFHTLPLDEQVAAVQRAWAEELPRLLVFDNADTDDAEALVAQYRPTTGGCRVLITSRRGVWDPALGITALPLGVLPRTESVALLRQFRADLGDADAEALAGELGDLPLALHLAGSFLQKYARSKEGDPAMFLARLRDPALLNHPALTGRATGAAWSYHERSVARAFALSYERLAPDDETDALARALLARAACCAPGEPIPGDLVRALVPTEDDLLAEDARARLTALGLLEQDGDAVTLHRLLAAFVRQIEADVEAQAAVEQALMDYPLADIPAAWLPILPHLRHVTAVALRRKDAQAARLANKLGYGLHTMLADYAAARPLFERALAIRERVLGADHPDTATILNNLAMVLDDTGDYAAARPLFERALDINERVLGADHPDTATSLNNLALLLRATGDYAAARPLYERALAIKERVLGADHPATATSLNNLAELLRATGDYAAARPLYERALAIDEAVYGPDHPEVATILNNLAGVLDSLGDYAAARPLYERALAIRERVLGADHPDTAQSLNNLALLLKATGDYAAARPLFERALDIHERVLGADHPATAQSLNNLAGVLKATGDYAAARALFERALDINERVLGADHPATATSLNNLAELLRATGDYAAARPLYERALAIDEAVYGPDHPEVATILNNLAGVLDSLGDYAAARPLYERALAIRERVLGADHPATATSLNNLAELLRATGDYAAARPLYERALAIRERVLGADHPDTATSLNNLALLLQATGDYAAARPLFERALAIRERVLGADHPDTATSLNNLAVVLEATGDYAAARPLFERALAIDEAVYGPDHPEVATDLNNLALLLQATGDYAAARALFERALDINERVLGMAHPNTTVVRRNLERLIAQMDGD